MSDRHEGRRFVLLDRDGTLNVERHYLSNPDELELLPGVAAGLRRLKGLGFGLAVITNQSAIGRGHFNVDRLSAIHERLEAMLHAGGVALDGIYYCPHVPHDGCGCRKPAIGLVRSAERELGFQAAAGFMIGDKPADIELGLAVGATTFLVRTGYGLETEASGSVRPHYVVDGVDEAAKIIAGLVASREAAAFRVGPGSKVR